MEFCGSGVILWNVILETRYEFHKCLCGLLRQGAAGDKKMNKNNDYPLKNPLLYTTHCAKSVHTLSHWWLADQWPHEIGMNDPGVA